MRDEKDNFAWGGGINPHKMRLNIVNVQFNLTSRGLNLILCKLSNKSLK